MLMTPKEKDARNVERFQATGRADMALHDALTTQERQTIWNALSVAAGRYDEDAKAMREAGLTRLVEQFERQAADARELIDRFE